MMIRAKHILMGYSFSFIWKSSFRKSLVVRTETNTSASAVCSDEAGTTALHRRHGAHAATPYRFPTQLRRTFHLLLEVPHQLTPGSHPRGDRQSRQESPPVLRPGAQFL